MEVKVETEHREIKADSNLWE